MDEAERCGGYIYNSKLIAIGTVAELQKLPDANPPGTVRVEIDIPNPSQTLDRIRTLQGVQEATIFGHAIHALIQQDRLEALQLQLPGASIKAIEPSLEDVFVTLTYKIMAETQ
jgi:ABC-2 type transport system ATP-binding protein